MNDGQRTMREFSSVVIILTKITLLGLAIVIVVLVHALGHMVWNSQCVKGQNCIARVGCYAFTSVLPGGLVGTRG